jgi:4-hydroxy-tetrahydrodipicolinate reductase
MTKTNIAIVGARGRMGQMTFREVMADETAACSAMLVRPGSPDEGAPVFLPDTKVGTGLNYTTDKRTAFGASDVIVDFSTVEAVMENLKLAQELGVPIAIGVTGFSEDQKILIKEAAETLPVLLSYNMSLGATALAVALGPLSATLGEDFHLEITDIHHKMKKDAPSGTALMLGEATGREDKDIKYTSHREGNVIGEHHILFSGPGEQIEMVHRAMDRRLFAKGALMAAHWLDGQKPGFYSLKDVLKS